MQPTLTETPNNNKHTADASDVAVDLEKLSAAVGENSRLQSQLHSLFAARLMEFRGDLQAVCKSLQKLDERLNQSSPGPAAPTAIAVGDNLVLTKVLGRFLMYLETSDMSVMPHLVADGYWEKSITEAFVARLRPGLTVVDVGANYGYYTLLAASHVGWDGRAMTDGRVYAFEPDPRTFQVLTKNVQVNGLSTVVKAYAQAALDIRKALPLHRKEKFVGETSLFAPLGQSESAPLSKECPVIEAWPLDEIIHDPVDVMKIDAEGCEPLIFRGMRKVLARSPELTVFLEFSAPMIERTIPPREFLREIRDLGFALKWFTPWGTLENFEEARALEYPRFDLLLERKPHSAPQPIVRATFSEMPKPNGNSKVASPEISNSKTDVFSQGFVPTRFEVVHHAPVWMTMSERVLLYGLIAGLRPRRCLEIGTFQGGSALIITAALDDLGEGKLACVDPEPQVRPEHWSAISHRATLFTASSPDILPQAARAVGGKFDFALIDGDHRTEGVLRDIEGTLPHLEDSAYLLFHDAHNADTAAGIDRALNNPKNGLTDAGMLSSEKTADAAPGVFWGGLRLLRFMRPLPSEKTGTEPV